MAKDLRDWATKRQADLVLYLGAFLLSVSALIFVSYQGGGLDGIAKSGLFGAYTAMFLVLGLQLRKWARVQEAGPVFLALGAILVPLNFVALYTNVLRGEDVAQEYVWLAGSVGTSVLYFFLARRGFGRLYAVPGGVAAFAGYASLGACLQLPGEWFGPWFLALAVAANVFAQRQPVALRRWIEGGAYALAIPSLGFTGLAMLAEGTQDGALAAAFALSLAAIGRSAFPSKRALFIGLLPVFGTLSIASAVWTIDAWSDSVVGWTPAWLLAMSAGYLVTARIRRDLAEVWASVSLLLGALAIGAAHIAVADGDAVPRLPFAYGLAALIAFATHREQRYVAALALVPVLIAAGAESAVWAAGWLEFEWTGCFMAGAGLAYIGLARLFPARAMAWRTLAAAFASAALVAAHFAAGMPEIHRWELAGVYALVAAGATFDALRFRPSALVALFAVAFGTTAGLWAIEVQAASWALPSLAVAVAIVASDRWWRADSGLEALGWPAALVLAMSPLALIGEYVDEPWIGAGSFALTALVFFAAALRTNGAFVAIAGYTTTRAAAVERQMLARVGSWALFAAGGFVNLALELSPVEGAWTFAIAGIGCWLAVGALRGRIASLEDVLAPVGLTGALVAVFAAYPNHDHTSMILGCFAVAAALATGGRYPMAWRLAYAGAGAFALMFAHNQAELVGRDAWQLPAAYGIVLVALLWDSAWNRFQPAMLAAPGVAAAVATAFGWWQDWPLEDLAWAPLGIAFAIAASERLWSRGSVVRLGAWPWVLLLSLAPFALLGEYDRAAWAGAIAFALSTAAWGTAAWRSNGALARVLDLKGNGAERGERELLALLAFGIGLATLGQTNFALEAPLAEAAWTFTAVGALALGLTCLRDDRVVGWHSMLTIGGTAAFAIGMVVVPTETGTLAAMLGIAAGVTLASGLVNASSPRVVVSAVLAAIATALLWQERDWEAWTLALTYGGAAAVLFAGLAPPRKGPGRLADAVMALSAAPIVLAVATAALATAVRAIAADIDREDLAIATTAEWAAMAATIALGGLMLLGEGLYRTGRRWVIAGSAVLLFAGELGIAILEPSNVQAFTLPVALYLIGLGLTARRSDALFGPHMFAHELLFVLGAAVLVLPPTEQSFEPGGGNWGLLVIFEGIALLALGLALVQRWLVVGGVVTLVAVAGRFFFDASDGGRLPYWATLGFIGLALLGIGVLMLLERDWWDRTKARLTSWWLEGEEAGDAGVGA